MKGRDEVQQIVAELQARRAALRVLEAGCGSVNQLELGADARVVGIDISEQQLARNQMLSEKILGDIQTYPLRDASFDLIVCWDVLEHLPHPEQALDNFARALAPGGLIVLAFPDVTSLKAVITKYTPHAFHVWAYRNVFRDRRAGTEGRGPFKTYLRSSIAPDAINAWAIDRGLRVRLLRRYEAFSRLIASSLLRSTWRVVARAVTAVTMGRIDGNVSDAIVVLERPDQRT